MSEPTRSASVALLFPDGRAGRTALDAWADGRASLRSTDPALALALAELPPGTAVVPVAPARAPWRPWRRSTEITVGEGATLGDLRGRFEAVTGGGDDREFAAFVVRQGALALERAERSRTGRPKIPRLVQEEVRASARFRHGLATLAADLGRPRAEVEEEAAAQLAEMVAAQSPLAVEAFGRLGTFAARAYRTDVDTTRLTELAEGNRRGALVFLPSHRSYLDPLVLGGVLAEHGFPPNHVLGGVNVSFWPLGPIGQRAGLVFIRRSIRDDAVYRFVLREYIGYLLRKHFNLEWYIEGGRTRTGKLRPPRLGILAYLVRAFESAGGSDPGSPAGDVTLVPVSIVYDQLYEIGAMAAEETGGRKRPEGLGWALGYARAQGRRLGTVHIRFGEPLRLGQGLAEADGSVEKLAFEICHRINQAAAVTPNALVSLALLGVEDRALTLDEIQAALDPLLDYLERRGLPVTGGVDLVSPAGVRATLDALTRSGVLGRFDGGAVPVWTVERHLEAAFYRNGIAHFFLNRAIVELVATRARGLDEAWEEALALRDLLKYEFFFARKRDFLAELTDEVRLFHPGWPEPADPPGEVWARLTASHLYLAHRVVRSFLEAYLVVAEGLAARPATGPVDQEPFVAECLGVARQWRLQQRIGSTESVSAELFRSALRLAANRGLLEPEGNGTTERRSAFAAEVADAVVLTQQVRDAARADRGGPPAPGPYASRR